MSAGFKMFFDNYVDLTILAGSSVSSAQTEFPISNAYNQQRRSKVWRSNGYYNITSSNGVLIFRETSGGSDLTATIAVAEYASKTTFAAAIKTALDAAGASTYTVTIADADGFKIKIVSDGAGGDGSFHFMLTDILFTSASILGFGTDSDLTDALTTRTADFIKINSEEFIEWDMGVSTKPTGFALIGSRNRPIQLSPGGVYKLQGNFTNNWSSPDYEVTLTYADNAFYVSDDMGLGGGIGYRFWRFAISDQNPTGYVEVGAFMLGDYFNPSRGCVQFPFSVNEVDRTDTLFSEGGQTYSDIKQKTAEYNISWFALRKADIELLQTHWDFYGTGIPFFVNVDSSQAFSTTSQKRLLFVKFASEPSWALTSPDVFEVSMVLREEL